MLKQHKIYVENPEQNVLDQFYSALEQDYVVKGALMADAHLGYSLPIGGVIATKDVIVPAWIGFDIGCGVASVRTPLKKQDVEKHKDEIFKRIYEKIPVGFKHNRFPSQLFLLLEYCISDFLEKMFIMKNGSHQIGTLGGGNHFIEIGYDAKGNVWIIIHSGSRGIGHVVATHYMKLASGDGKAREGHFGLRTDSDVGQEYIMDMAFCLQFAARSREAMTNKVMDILLDTCNPQECGAASFDININHNHAELEDGLWVHRKGAVQADKDMMGVIPGNMRDGSFIVKGKGNPDSLNSSSHGAGRAGSRKWAKQNLSMATFEKSMTTITAKVDSSTLDESPLAYKDIFKVMDLQKDLVKVIMHIKPIINVKGKE